jgi:hypothetical protein
MRGSTFLNFSIGTFLVSCSAVLILTYAEFRGPISLILDHETAERAQRAELIQALAVSASKTLDAHAAFLARSEETSAEVLVDARRTAALVEEVGVMFAARFLQTEGIIDDRTSDRLARDAVKAISAESPRIGLLLDAINVRFQTLK